MSVLRYVPFTAIGNCESAPSVICLGKFDGVHVGHTKLLEETQKMSLSLKARACALCFFPSPADYFAKTIIRHVLTLDEKLEVFKASGIDGVYICDFEKIYDYSPEKFIDDVLVKNCNCIGAVCGFNYRFGHKAAGKPEDLEARFANFEKVPAVMINGQTVSTSLIKEKIEAGKIEEANEMLGRPFSIAHTVVHGQSIGKKLGFPTLNYVFENGRIIPSFGVYATVTEIDGNKYVSVTNVGIRPTISSSETITCETHIVNCQGDLYGKNVKVGFMKKLRDEKKFSSMEELSVAIASDVKNTKNFFGLK